MASMDGLGTEVALPVAGLNTGSRGVEETEAFGGEGSHCEARSGGLQRYQHRVTAVVARAQGQSDSDKDGYEE